MNAEIQKTVDKVKEAASIVDVVGEFVTLRKAGVNYKGVCPFHDDHAPSMVVSPARQTFKCFVCGEGGDVIHFLRKHEDMTFMEALEWLCRKYHIDMPKREVSDDDQAAWRERESQQVVLTAAQQYFRDHLAEAASFLAARGYGDIGNITVLADYGVGYAPSGNGAMANLTKAGYQPDIMKKVGLVATSDRGDYDVFRDRVMFPFYDLKGQVVGWSGRLVTPREHAGKYVNTGETPLFTKGDVLFGLYQARKAIAKEGFAYLVEGQFDVLTLARYGVRNVIGGSGTAFTDRQVRLITRFTDRVVMIYDADQAGTKAAQANTRLLLLAGCQVEIARLPKDKDPDEFGREVGDKLPQLLRDYTETFPRALKRLLVPHGNKNENVTADARGRILSLVACVQNAGLRFDYGKSVAKDFGIRLPMVEEELRRLRSGTDVAVADGSAMKPGVYGLDVVKDKIEDDRPIVLTSRLQDFLDQFDESPVLLLCGVPGETDVLTLRRTYGYYVAGEQGLCLREDGSESDFMRALSLMFRAGISHIDVAAGDHTETFLDYYIGCHGRLLKEYQGNKVPLITRCIELTSFAEENVITVNRTSYCRLLGVTKGEFDDIRKPFVQQRRSQQKVSLQGDGLDEDEYFDEYNPPQYVQDNDEYMRMWKEYQFYPRLNKKGLPVCYLFRNQTGQGMTQVGDFYMEPLLHIFSDDFDQNKRVLRVNRRRYETPVYIEVLSRSLLKMSTIEDVLINYEGINFSNGKEEYWRKIREYMSYRYVMCSEVDIYGNQQTEGVSRRPEQQFFAFANGIAHLQGGVMRFEKSDELGVCSHNGKNYYLPAFSTVFLDSRRRQERYQFISQLVYKEVPADRQVSFDEWARMMDRVYRINDNGKWAVLFAVMSAFRSNIHCIDRQFTAPFFSGPMTSGKTQIAVSIRSLFVSPHQSIFNLNTGTDAAMQSYMGAFRDVPVVLDEYNDKTISDVKFQALKSIVYDGEDKTKRKGSSGREFESDKVFTPVVLCGQEKPERDDNALMSRVVICDVPKPKDRTREDTELFLRLKRIEDPNEVGLSNILLQVLALRPAVMDHFHQLKREAYDELRGADANDGERDRLMKTVSLFLATVKLLERYSTLRLPFTYAEFFRIAKTKVEWQLGLIRTTDRLAAFFTAVNGMIDTGAVREGRDFLIQSPRSVTGQDANGQPRTFTFEGGRLVLFLRLKTVYSNFNRGGYNRAESSLTTIEQNLQSHPSYLGTVSSRRFVWTEVKEEFDPGVQKVIKTELTRQTVTSAVIIDYTAFMEAYNIDFRRDADIPDDDEESTAAAVQTGASAVSDAPAVRQDAAEQDMFKGPDAPPF